MTTMANELKDQAREFFNNKEYTNALSKYTQAIEAAGGGDAIFFANRAACYLALNRYQECLADAQKATELDPAYIKAWFRLGAAHNGLKNYPESIESYQKAVSLATNAQHLRREAETALNDVIAKIMNPKTVSIDIIKALARAYDIPVPLPHTEANRKSITKAVFQHPRYHADPPLRLLLIPESQTEPLKPIELPRDKGDVMQRINRVLGCALHDSVVLHAEDLVAYAQGKPYGVGLGRMHTSYEAFMDDDAVTKRPLNRRACELLHRPRTFGPILVMKTTFIKTRPDTRGRTEDILCWERVTEEELRSERYKKLREEWIRVMGTGDLPHVLDILPM